jgi:hypothetical protein
MSALLLAVMWTAGTWPAFSQTSPIYVWTNFVGQPGASGTNYGTGSGARFDGPYGVTVDSADNVFVADEHNHTIRKVTSTGVVTTLAGSAGASGTNDGTGSAARFYYPFGVAVDKASNVFVADWGNNTIRKVTSSGVVTTIAGSAGTSGTNDGTGSGARFDGPYGVTVDSADNLFVADEHNHTIRKVTSMGVVTTVAGSAGTSGTNDGTGSAARFDGPYGVTVDSAGNVFAADWGNNRVSKGTPIYPWLTVGFDGMNVQLSWPANCLGWELQAQTNLPGAGLGTNWFPLAGSTTNTQTSIPIDPASPGMFYRLHHQLMED